MEEKFAQVSRSRILPSQQVELGEKAIYFIDHYGNAEMCRYSEMATAGDPLTGKHQFLELTPQQRANAISHAFGLPPG